MGEIKGMARQVRIQFEGAVYHVMAIGDRRESIIAGDKILTLAASMFEISFGVTSSAVATRQYWSRAGNSAPAII